MLMTPKMQAGEQSTTTTTVPVAHNNKIIIIVIYVPSAAATQPPDIQIVGPNVEVDEEQWGLRRGLKKTADAKLRTMNRF